MARVPVSQGPQIRDANTPAVFQNTPDVSSGYRALSQGLGAAANVADRVVVRDAETAANAADAEITGAWLQWDSQARQTYRGTKVGDYEADAAKWWEDAKGKYTATLDPLSQRMVGQQLQRKRVQALGGVSQFVSTEKERQADDAAQASIATTIQFAVTSGDVAGAGQSVRQAVATMGARKGWTTEQVQAEVSKNLSMMHLAQISKLASTDAAAAQGYYDANKAEVGFAQQARVEEILKKEMDNQFADKFAAEVGPLPYEEQLSKASEIPDQERRARTMLAIKTAHGAAKEARQEREAQFADQAWQMVGKGQRVPETILSGMDGHQRVQLQEFMRQRAEHAAEMGSKPVKTDPVLHAKLLDMARDNPEEFKALRMESLVYKVGATDLEQIAGLQRQMNKPDTEKDVATTTQIMSTYTGGWKPEKRAAFQSAYLAELNQLEKEKKRPATFEEKQKLGDRMVLDGEVLSGSWYQSDPNKKLFEVAPGDRARFAPTVSSNDRKLIKDALAAEGIANPTDEQIMQRFKLAKGIR